MEPSVEHTSGLTLSREVEVQRALDLAYGYLGKRDRTVHEVRGHLAGKDLDLEVADSAIAELVAQGYLDDHRYASLFAQDRRALDGWGRSRIVRRLRDLGVASATIDAALGADEVGAERKAAVALLRSRFQSPPSDDRGRDRALGFLARKGYELEVAYDAVRAFARGD